MPARHPDRNVDLRKKVNVMLGFVGPAKRKLKIVTLISLLRKKKLFLFRNVINVMILSFVLAGPAKTIVTLTFFRNSTL